MKQNIRYAVPLLPELEAKTFDLQGESHELLDHGKWEEAVLKIKEAWNLLPEPKFNTSCSHSILSQLIQTLTQTKQHHQARLILDQWIQDLEECGFRIIEFDPFVFSGENYLWTGDPDKAKEQFYKAVSYGATIRAFKHHPPLYFDIATQIITDDAEIMEIFNSGTSNQSYGESHQHNSLSQQSIDQIEALSELGNIQFDEEHYTMAIQTWKKALSLIPKPQHLYSESQWLEVSIGDAYFLLEDHYQAYSYFENARINIESNAYENPFIMLRLGQTSLENNQEEQAKEYLMRAYLFEGKEIFENDDAKYFEFLTKHVDLIQ